MAVPANAVQRQGLGSVSADQANSFIQTVNNLSQLRDFIAVDGMEILLKGYVSPADGGQGMYYWQSSNPGPDNGSSVIQPIGVSLGAWVRIPFVASSALVLTWTGAQTTANQFLGGEAAGFPYVIPQGLVGSVGLTPETAPAADYVVTIKLNGVVIGSATWVVADSEWVFASAANHMVAIGGQVKLYGAGDTDIVGFGLTIKALLS